MLPPPACATVGLSRRLTRQADQRSLFLLVLCPGFFSCPELIDETAHPPAQGAVMVALQLATPLSWGRRSRLRLHHARGTSRAGPLTAH